MTPAELADRITRARQSVLRGGSFDPYVGALAELSALAEERLLAQYELEDCAHGDGDLGAARNRIQRADRALHDILGIPAGLKLRRPGAMVTLSDRRQRPRWRVLAALSNSWRCLVKAWQR